MECHVILHDSTGSFLLLQKGRSNSDSPHLITVHRGSFFDELAHHVYHRITGTQPAPSQDPPLSVRYFIESDDADDDHHDRLAAACVLESTGRRCNIPLSTDYIWTRINPVLMKHMEQEYSPLKVQAIKNIAAETLDNSSNNSVPWFSKRGSVKQVRKTIRSRLKQYGYGGIRSTEHRYSTASSMIFEIKLREARVFYKISARGRPEALFTQTLARLLPEHVLVPFGVDMNDNSFFTEDFGFTMTNFSKRFDREYARKHLIEPAIDSIAKFHEKASKHVEELKELGMEETSPQKMRTKLPQFISELQERTILNREDAQDMRDLLPLIVSKLNVLIDGKIPLTVCHGDLHSGNVAEPRTKDGFPLLFDWHESSISHPFLDFMYGTFAESPLPEVYAEKWQKYDSSDRVMDMLDVADDLIPLWTVFQRVRMMENRGHQLGANQDWGHCHALMSCFITDLFEETACKSDPISDPIPGMRL